MARIRTIKPEFWTDGDMLRLSRDARLFYIGLWNFADDNGVLDHDIIGLKAKIFPNDPVKIEKLIEELQNANKLYLYKIENKSYILVKNLSNHQYIERKRKSNLPLPDLNHVKSCEISELSKEGKEGRIQNQSQIQELFEKFWLIYPRKVAKQKALIRWISLSKKYGREFFSITVPLMFNALEKQKLSKQWIKDSGEFIPHPASWLNQERWNDEVKDKGDWRDG